MVWLIYPLYPTDTQITFIMKIKFKITNLHIEEATREAQKLTEAQKSLTPRTNSENTNSEYRYDICSDHKWSYLGSIWWGIGFLEISPSPIL